MDNKILKNKNKLINRESYQPPIDALHSHFKEETLILNDRLKQIALKNDCMRVRFLDRMAAAMIRWAEVVQNKSNQIKNPCIIKIGNKK